MATIMYPSLTKSQSMRSKRKSAVELLAESKAFYVKSETVRDSQQVLPLRIGHPTLCTHNTISTATYMRSKSNIVTSCIPQNTIGGWRPISMPQYMAVSPSRSLPPPRVSNGRRSTSACSDVLQNKLRKLLNTDSRENVSSNLNDCLVDDFTPISPPAEYAITERSSYSRYGNQSSPEHRVVHKSLPDLHTQQQSRESCSNRSASNKSLSNRDSGESSGHYTHRSEPAPCSEPPRPEIRRDSGSSTQHSGASIYCCAADHQDSHHITYSSRTTRYGYPPPQEYRPPPPTYEYANQPYQDPTLSPGPGTFKRQKCFRYKQRERSVESSRPILRSKSDISDRYWRGPPPLRKTIDSAPVSHLEQFFEQLGLNSDSYENMLDNNCDSDSPVFFSDVSTVDSSRPIDNTDYCTPPAPPPFRPSEPPSIVERNARIIKWLCNCRKLQITNS